jgi:hypothetical protein
MERLSIPKKYQDGVKLLMRLDGDSVTTMITAMEVAADPYSKGVAEEVAENIHHPVDAVIEAISALRALYTVRAGADVALLTFAEDVLKSSAEFTEPALTGSQSAQALQSISRLLGIKKLQRKSRTQSALVSDERAFCKARFTTDIRPIPSDEPGSDPESAVVIHHLKLGYHEDQGKHKNFYIAFYTDDLKKLKEAIVKAEQAEKILMRYVPLFSPSEKEI